MKDVIEEAKMLDKKFNFFITIAKDIKFGKGKLAGEPVGVKDNICTKGIQSTAGSAILKGYVPPFDATVIAKMKQAGAAVIGKTAMDEFGFGTFSVNCTYKIPKNPADTTRSCGGSSGGAAGYVAASKFSRMGIAVSTGGSISCPASFCGVVGVTPTYGRVSRYGLIDYSNSLDKIGTVGKSVADIALLLSVISGKDARDPTTVESDPIKIPSREIKKLKVALPKEYFKNLEPQVEKAVRNALGLMEKEGWKLEDVNFKYIDHSLAAYYIIATAEASTNLAKFCGMRYGLEGEPEGKGFNEYFSEIRSKGFGEEAKRRILLGTFARMAGYRDQYYFKALKVRTLAIEEFKRIFKRYDIIAAPTMPMIAPKFSDIEKLQPIQHYISDILTVPPNLAGLPHISVPCKANLPVGLHLIGNHFTENKLIEAAASYEIARGKL